MVHKSTNSQTATAPHRYSGIHLYSDIITIFRVGFFYFSMFIEVFVLIITHNFYHGDPNHRGDRETIISYITMTLHIKKR